MPHHTEGSRDSVYIFIFIEVIESIESIDSTTNNIGMDGLTQQGVKELILNDHRRSGTRSSLYWSVFHFNDFSELTIY